MLHGECVIAYGLRERGVAGNARRNDAKLVPLVANEYAQHRLSLVLDRRRQLQRVPIGRFLRQLKLLKLIGKKILNSD